MTLLFLAWLLIQTPVVNPLSNSTLTDNGTVVSLQKYPVLMISDSKEIGRLETDGTVIIMGSDGVVKIAPDGTVTGKVSEETVRKAAEIIRLQRARFALTLRGLAGKKK